MYNKNNNKRVNELNRGDLIGYDGNFVYLGRNAEKEAEARAAGHNYTMVDASCRRCGSVKAYNLGNIKSGNTKTCGCGRKKTVNLNKLIADIDREFDDRAKIQENNPHKGYVINGAVPNGLAVSVMARGEAERWIKGLILQDPEEAAAMRYAAYIADGELFGQTKDHYGDGQAKFADNRTVMVFDGINADVYEEYDGHGHNYDNPSTRDKNVDFGCATHNKGLFRISTKTPAFKNRDAEAVMALRQFAMNRIRQNVVHNIKVGFNELPTLIRVSKKRGIEEGVACDGDVLWTKIADISAILAARC